MTSFLIACALVCATQLWLHYHPRPKAAQASTLGPEYDVGDPVWYNAYPNLVTTTAEGRIVDVLTDGYIVSPGKYATPDRVSFELAKKVLAPRTVKVPA